MELVTLYGTHATMCTIKRQYDAICVIAAVFACITEFVHTFILKIYIFYMHVVCATQYECNTKYNRIYCANAYFILYIFFF